ncbi:MAG: haloacid dehalogenase [Candidatus Xenobia bacterium]
MNKQDLEAIAQRANDHFSRADKARERALPLHREVIRFSGLSIRAVHRHEFDEARTQIGKAAEVMEQIRQAVGDVTEVYYAGFIQDAQKEFAEANLTLALVTDGPLPLPDTLRVDIAAFMNGMAEAIGELRRYILDGLRNENDAQAERFLEVMDEIYYVLVTMDFPDALTRGLRRSTDVARSLIEKTRGELTSHLANKRLQQKLEAVRQQVG